MSELHAVYAKGAIILMMFDEAAPFAEQDKWLIDVSKEGVDYLGFVAPWAF